MGKVGEFLRVDASQVSVADIYSITEPGEDGDTWQALLLQDGAGALSLFVEEGEELTLYRPLAAGAAPADPIQWDYDQLVKLDSAVHGKRGKVCYATGDSNHDRSFLKIDVQMWEMDDHVLRYGPKDAWLARATSPASALQPFVLDEKCEAPQRVSVLGWTLLGLFALWGIASTITGRHLGFGWGYWIVGISLVTVSTFSHARRPRLAFSASFGLFLLTAFALVPLLASFVPPARAATLLALIWLLVMSALAWTWHRGFYLIGDSAIKTGFVSLLVYTLGLLAVCVFDEDFSWLESWWWYFQASPYRYFWPPIFVGFLIYYYHDYKDVPLSPRGFAQLRGRVVRHLSSQNPWTAAKQIGDGADDLADALHLSEAPEVRALAPYRELLQEIARVFRTFDSKGEMVTSMGPVAEHIRADLALLAEELAEMGPEGKGMRISPLLRFVTGNNPEAGDFLDTFAARKSLAGA